MKNKVLFFDVADCPRCAGTGKLPTGQGLRDARESRGKALADIGGFSVQYLSDVERGRRAVTLEVVALYQESLADQRKAGV